MRSAFVGLSSPTAYYYDHNREYSNEWKWIPIIESPQGLMTLFDEIWFLHPALCPITMRQLDFVKFIVDDTRLLEIVKKTIGNFENIDIKHIDNKNREFIESAVDIDYRPDFNNYNNIIHGVFGTEPSRRCPIDNHSHMFEIDGVQINGDSTSLKNIFIDVALLHEIQNTKNKSMELITNTFSEPALLKDKKNLTKIRISQGVTISRVPVLQHPNGPEISGIEKIRENKFLVDFRNKINKLSDEYSTEETKELIMNIETEFDNYRNDVLINKQTSSKVFNSLIKNLASTIVDEIMDGIAPGSTFVKKLIDDRNTRKMNWTAFLATIERQK
jgi:hypothetical protein